MKISVQEVDSCEEEEIIIKCHEMNDDIMELVRRLKMEQHRLTAYRDDKVYRLSLHDVYYFEQWTAKRFCTVKTRSMSQN